MGTKDKAMNTIVNVGIGTGHAKGSFRLVESLNKNGFKGQVKTWTNNYPEGSPTHADVPYAFKPHALKWAKDQGAECALWLDSSVWLQHPIEPIFDIIKEQGYFVMKNGWTTGNWSTDRQLKAYNLTREQAFSVPHAIAGMLGVNFKHKEGLNLFNEYFANQHLFHGAWTNESKQVSKDVRVLGSRHDQTILSLIMHKYNYKYLVASDWSDYVLSSKKTNEKAILLLAGM